MLLSKDFFKFCEKIKRSHGISEARVDKGGTVSEATLQIDNNFVRP